MDIFTESFTVIEDTIIKPNSKIHIKEEVDKNYIERVYSDILTFLKNVNRLKDAESFFDLIDYWIYWRNEEFSVFEKKISGKGLNDKEHHDDTITGRIINRLEKAITGLFYVDEKDITKYLKKELEKGNYVSFPNVEIELLNNAVNKALKDKEKFKDMLADIIRRNYSEEYLEFINIWENTYFTIWKNNASSRYISTKKIVDEVFEELNSYFLEDQFVEDIIVRDNVRIYLSYMESQIDAIYDALKKVESALTYFSRKDWGKKILPEMEMAIDFVNPKLNYTFKTSYGLLGKNGGCYVTTDDLVVIAKQYVISDYIFEILAHEIGHRYYYRVMNKVGREEWEELYNSLKTGSNMSEYKKSLLFFSDNLLGLKETYKKNLRKSSSNFSSYTKDFGSVKGYFNLIDEIYFKNKHGTLLTDFIYDYSEKDFKYGFELDSLYTIVNARVEGEARRGNISITNSYDDYELLTPATIEIINGKIIELFKESVEAEEKEFIKSFPTQYAGENASELFAETFAANAIKSLNIKSAKNYNVSEHIYDTFRHITGIRERSNSNSKKHINEKKIKFKDESRGYHSGQMDMVLYVIDDDNNTSSNIMGYVDYSIYQESVYIEMVEVDEKYRRKGIGKELISYLAKEYGYENIEWGMMTAEGFELQKAMDKKFGIDRNKIKSNFIDATILKDIKRKNPTLGKWSEDLYKYGSEKAWDTWASLDYTKENYSIMQSIDDILSWVNGSKSNNNGEGEEPPYYIFDMIIKDLGIRGYSL